jgi:nucleoside-diphosphate-sugar epimerase
MDLVTRKCICEVVSAEETGTQVQVTFTEEEGFEEMPRRVPDVSKIQGAVGWSPTRSLDEILGDVGQLAAG